LDLVALVEVKTISSSAAQQVFAEMFESGKAPAPSCRKKASPKSATRARLKNGCDEAIAANPAPVVDYESGKVAALNSLKGQVMKLAKGKAHPALVGQILERKPKA
jgi:aspartyl-tRNA(Asn)/glutamyl-tRNA(Gln) amidotransferase subunit B